MANTNHQNIVILTNGNYFAQVILQKFLEAYRNGIVGILIVTGDYKGRSNINALFELGKVTALPYLLFKVSQKVLFRILNFFIPGRLYDVESLASKHDIPVKKTISINTDSAYDWVKRKQPALLVSVSCPQMIKNKFLSLAPNGGINIHSSLLPKYAGLAPYFWVLANDEKETGVTIHYMTLKFDQGNIIKQDQLPIFENDTAHSLFLRLAVLGNQLLPDAVNLVFDGFKGTRQNLDNYSYFSHPTYIAYRRLRKNGHVLMHISDIIKAIRGEVDNPI
jgi:folate-dependent phosphoribosylglycinamide formyltransferase PurN